MKKPICIFLSIMLLVFCAYSCVACNSKNEEKNDVKNAVCYDIDIEYADEKIVCSQKTTVIGDMSGADLVFRVVPVNYTQKAVNSAYFDKPSRFCQFNISKLTLNGISTDYELTDDGFLTVFNPSFGTYVDEIKIDYEVLLPRYNANFGVDQDGTVSLASFYPQLADKENGEFVKREFLRTGKTVYNSEADYNVTLKCDSKITAAGSGQTALIAEGNKSVYTYRLKAGRDFAVILGENFKKESAKAGDTEVNYYYISDFNKDRSLNTIVNSLKTFNEAIGKYKYETLTIVNKSQATYSSRYSGIAVVGKNTDAEYALPRAVSYMWFGDGVGIDANVYGGLLEGTNSLSAIFYRLLIGEKEVYNSKLTVLKNKYLAYQNKFYKTSSVPSCRKSTSEYSLSEYENIADNKSAIMFLTVMEMVGRDKFFAGLRSAYGTYISRDMTMDDFVSCLSSSTKLDVSGLINAFDDNRILFTTVGNS